jgi:hypothetical protein
MSLSSAIRSAPSWVYSLRTVTKVRSPVRPSFIRLPETYVVRAAGRW